MAVALLLLSHLSKRYWRGSVAGALVACVGGSVCLAVGKGASDPLEQVRHAIGRGRPVASVHSLSLHGMARSGFNGVTAKLLPPHRVTIEIDPPDKYVRTDDDGMITRRMGISADGIIDEWTASSPSVHMQHRRAHGLVGQLRDEARRLMIGLLGTVLPPDRPAVVRLAGQNILVDLGHGKKWKLATGDRSLLPRSLTYEDSIVFLKPLKRSQLKNGVPPLPPARIATVQLEFLGHRLVSGLEIPFHIVRLADGVVIEDITITEAIVR